MNVAVLHKPELNKDERDFGAVVKQLQKFLL